MKKQRNTDKKTKTRRRRFWGCCCPGYGFMLQFIKSHRVMENGRAKECNEMCMSIKKIITLIPEE